jgi:1-acyl-sn-glycerol-3-phosphate acyltransferase
VSETAPRLRSWVVNWVGFPLAWVFVTVFFGLLGPLRAKNRRAIPRHGGFLLVANHRSDIDPILLQWASHRRIYFMAKSELFPVPILGHLMRAYGAFPVKRGEPDRASLRYAQALTEMGEAVGIFPEGELSETGEMLPLKPGVALLVRMAKVPVICVGLRRTEKIMPYGLSIPRPAFGWVSAEFGEPRQFEAKASTEEIMEWLESELRRLTS